MKVNLTDDERHFLNEVMDLISPNYDTGIPEMFQEHLGETFSSEQIEDLAQSIFDKTVR